jgi:hypothetical protein|tara:strand:- start:3001 stop:3696 length:696 start_codon:yes stop_codon:yes gene_type:complete
MIGGENVDETRVNLLETRTRWINVSKDTEKASQMVELLGDKNFTNHERFNALTEDAEFGWTKEKSPEWFVTHMCGLSHRKLLMETIIKDDKPVLILEDDVEIEHPTWMDEIPVPRDADAVYLGTSHSDMRYRAEDHGNGWNKITGVFGTHAILHLNKKYASEMCIMIERCVKNNHPFDVSLAKDLQGRFNVYAPYSPFFYQADSKNTTNKYEAITRPPLTQQKKFTLGTFK